MEKEKKWERVTQEFAPVCDENSRVLILGTAPSRKSREVGFYYGHPQNRFWKVMAAVLDWPVPKNVDEKRRMLIENHIAIWDVIESCSIIGSGDASIKDVKVNDFSGILANSKVKRIFVNGAKAYQLYHKYGYPVTGIKAVKLPSTSPANAAFSIERLIREWKKEINGGSENEI